MGGGTCNLWLDFPEDTRLTVIDKSLQMIFAAKENIPWANFMLDDILTLEKKELGKFDIVVSTFTLHHISYDQQEKAIKNMIDLCRDGGRILIVDRSFHDQAEKEKRENELEDAGNMRFLEIIRSEFYLISDQVMKYIRYMGLQADTLFFEEEIWGFLIKKNIQQNK
jgi:SAM-dependent methyltransferase